MAIVGLDVEQVQNLGQQLKQQAEAIHGVMTQLDHLVNESQNIWKGKDATDFHGWWLQQHRPHLDQVRQAVEGLGQSAINNAHEQAQVSGH